MMRELQNQFSVSKVRWKSFMPLEPSIPSVPSILPVPSVPSIPSHPAPGWHFESLLLGCLRGWFDHQGSEVRFWMLHCFCICCLCFLRWRCCTLVFNGARYAKPTYGHENAISYNFEKTRVMFLGNPTRSLRADSFRLNGGVIEIVDKWKYLGFFSDSSNGHFVFNFNPTEERKSFYRSSNCVINALYKSS